MNYLFNPYMSKEPVFRLFKPPLECQRPIYRLCVKCHSSMTSHRESNHCILTALLRAKQIFQKELQINV